MNNNALKCDDHSLLEDRIKALQHRTGLLSISCKEAWQRMMFSYQFFEEDRTYFNKLDKRRLELDRELALLDGRLKKLKAKEEVKPRSKKVVQPAAKVMTKEKLIAYLQSLSKEEKEVFLSKFTAAFKNEV